MNTEESQESENVSYLESLPDMIDFMIHMLGYFGEVKLIDLVIDAVTHHNFDMDTAERFILMKNHEDRAWFAFRMKRINERGEAQ